MFLKFLLYSTLMCLAVADVKHLPRTYLPPSSQESIKKADIDSLKARDVLDLPTNEIVEKNLGLQNSVAFTKEAAKDPINGNNPFGIGCVNGFPGAFPNQQLPGQVFPGQFYPAFPPQGFPGQGFPVPGFNNPVIPPHGFPGPTFPNQGFINPAFPGASYPYNPGFYPAPGQFKSETNNDNEEDKPRLLVADTETQYDPGNGGYLYNKPSVTF